MLLIIGIVGPSILKLISLLLYSLAYFYCLLYIEEINDNLCMAVFEKHTCMPNQVSQHTYSDIAPLLTNIACVCVHIL